jgi:nitrogen fixation negative regulator NifL
MSDAPTTTAEVGIQARLAALRASGQLYEQVIASAQEGIIVLDRDLRYVLWSRFMEELSGVPADAVLGKHCLEVFPFLEKQGIYALMERALAGETVKSPDVPYEAAGSGRSGWICGWLGPLRDLGGALLGVISVVREISERKKTEAALQRSEARYRTLAEASQDMIFVIGRDGTIEYVNSFAASRLNRRAEELIGHPRTDFFPGGAATAQAENLRRVFEHGKALYVEDKVRFPGGDLWLGTWLVPIKDEGGEVTAVLGTSRNINERKRAEEGLRLQSVALESAANGIVIADRAATVLWCNAAFCRLTGYSAAEVLGKNLRFLKSGRHGPEFYAQLWETVLARRVWQGEMLNRRKDGSLYAEEQTITPVLGQQGEVAYFIAIKQDITERRRMETEVRHSRELFQRVFEANPTAMGISTLTEGRFLEVNASFLKLSGFDREEVIGRTDEELNLWVDPAQRQEFYRRIGQEGSLREFEAQLRGKGDRVCHTLVSVELLDLGLECCLLFSMEDVTERRSLEARLRQSQKMEAIGRLAGGVAHDFNNILTVIQGHTGLLELEPHSTSEARESLQQIAEAAERAAHLTRQLLTFSRQQPLQPRLLDLNEVVTNMTKMLRRLIGEDIMLECRYAPHLPPVCADMALLEQVLLNLAVNARDAMPGGGSLIISTEARSITPEQAGKLLSGRAGEFVLLTVRDSGRGISPDIMPRIFEPFFTTKAAGHGTGLGLATIHGIVQHHQGWVDVESQVGVGTAFLVFLPASPAAPAPADGTALQQVVPGGHETVLLVEDEAPLRDLARQLLTRRGYRVLEAASGVAALEVWSSHAAEIDVLVSDMILPGGLNGRELTNRLRREKPRLKVLLATGYSSDAIMKDLRPEEHIWLLQKPYSPAAFSRAVRDCLDERWEPPAGGGEGRADSSAAAPSQLP